MTFLVKDGTIEYTNGAAVPMVGFSTKVLSFDDGETVQNVVVDTTIERYATPGCSGRFAFVKKNKFLQLVGVETPDKGLQIGNVMLAGAGSGWMRAVGIGGCGCRRAHEPVHSRHSYADSRHSHAGYGP